MPGTPEKLSTGALIEAADAMGQTASDLIPVAIALKNAGWHVAAMQVTNAMTMLRDASRRLRAGDDSG